MQKEVYCVLNKPVVTNTNCFIAEKTPVKVVHWSSDKKKVLIETRIFVQEDKDKQDLEVCTCYISPEILIFDHIIWK